MHNNLPLNAASVLFTNSAWQKHAGHSMPVNVIFVVMLRHRWTTLTVLLLGAAVVLTSIPYQRHDQCQGAIPGLQQGLPSHQSIVVHVHMQPHATLALQLL